MGEEILKKDGLSLDKLQRLSYHSDLGVHLKKNLHYFDRESLFDELDAINGWYDSCIALHDIVTDYRIKSIQSARLKYEKYYPDHQARKVFDDMLGFRALCDNYEDILALGDCENIRVADLSGGKANDGGYRGVHVYFQLSNYHYPIEIQYNTYYDRQLNNWLRNIFINMIMTIRLVVRCVKNMKMVKLEQKKNLRRCCAVCYLIAKKFDDVGCLALQTEHGQHLSEFKKKLISEIGTEKIQLVTISRPSAYGEYEPYRFMDTEQEFEKAIKSL